MQKKIVTIEEVEIVAKKLQSTGQKIVLAGGCFDILHIGHIYFLQKARDFGDILMLFLESDERIKEMKGQNRPIFPQHDRAQLLSALAVVDYVILLPKVMSDKDYDDVILKLKPAIIAATKNDPGISHKKRQAQLAHAEVVEVVERIQDQSTSRLAAILEKEL